MATPHLLLWLPPPQLFYNTLELSKGVVTRFELVTFLPDNIKSQYFFLSRILEQLPHLTHLVITKVTQAMHQSKGVAHKLASFILFCTLVTAQFYFILEVLKHSILKHSIYCPLF